MPLKLEPPRHGHPNWGIRGTHLGVYIRRSSGTPDRRLAAQIRKRIETQIESGAVRTESPETFAWAVKAYVQSGHSKRFLAAIVKQIGDKPLSEFRDEARCQVIVDTLATSMYPDASPATRNRAVYTPISAVLRHVKVKNDITRPKGAAGRERKEWLSPEQAFALLDAAELVDERFGALCTFMIYTGCRLGEAGALTWDTVDLNSCKADVYMGKTDTWRTVYLPPPVVAALANLSPEAGDNRVWPRSHTIFRKLWGRACKRAGLSLSGVAFHVLRHTYGAWMSRFAKATTDDLVNTQAWADPRMARRYAHGDTHAAARLADLLPSRGMRRKA